MRRVTGALLPGSHLVVSPPLLSQQLRIKTRLVTIGKHSDAQVRARMVPWSRLEATVCYPLLLTFNKCGSQYRTSRAKEIERLATAMAVKPFEAAKETIVSPLFSPAEPFLTIQRLREPTRPLSLRFATRFSKKLMTLLTTRRSCAKLLGQCIKVSVDQVLRVPKCSSSVQGELTPYVHNLFRANRSLNRL